MRLQPAAGPSAEPGGANPAPSRVPLPDGFRIVLDAGTRRVDAGAVLVGGSPLTVLRLSGAGARLVADLAAGCCVPTAAAPNRLARRLLDLGMAHPRPPIGSQVPPITAVIPVRDDATGLTATLASLGPMERVVVVDDGSTDADAVERAVVSGSRRQCTRVLRLDRPQGPGGARQVGWQEAHTELVAFVDAGCVPEPGWLGPLADHLADPAVAAVAPRIRPRAPEGVPDWLVAYEELRSPLDLGSQPSAVRPHGRVPYVPTAALVVRRAAIGAVGGFDPTLRFGEDVDLVWRLAAAGWVVRYEPAAAVGHPVRPTLVAMLRQRFDYGCSAAVLADRHGDAVAPLVASSWSVLAWGLAALGHPVAGAAAAGVSTAALAPRLRALPQPMTEALRLAGFGHLRAGRLITDGCRRTWWPLALLGCVGLPRTRPAALLTAIVPPLLDPHPSPATMGLSRWLALRLLDDMAYGAGVWAGAARARSTSALRPRLTSLPGRRPGHPAWSRRAGWAAAAGNRLRSWSGR